MKRLCDTRIFIPAGEVPKPTKRRALWLWAGAIAIGTLPFWGWYWSLVFWLIDQREGYVPLITIAPEG